MARVRPEIRVMYILHREIPIPNEYRLFPESPVLIQISTNKVFRALLLIVVCWKTNTAVYKQRIHVVHAVRDVYNIYRL